MVSLTPRQTQALLLLSACPDPWEGDRVGLALGLQPRQASAVLVSLEARGLAARMAREQTPLADGWVATYSGAEAAAEARRRVGWNGGPRRGMAGRDR